MKKFKNIFFDEDDDEWKIKRVRIYYQKDNDEGHYLKDINGEYLKDENGDFIFNPNLHAHIEFYAR